jgi:hypothetical protein
MPQLAGGPPPRIADPLPKQVPLQELPAAVSQDVVQGHKFVGFDRSDLHRSNLQAAGDKLLHKALHHRPLPLPADHGISGD